MDFQLDQHTALLQRTEQALSGGEEGIAGAVPQENEMEREVHGTLEDVGEEDRITARTPKTRLHLLAEIEDETVWSHVCSSKTRTGFAKKGFATRTNV